MLISIPHKVRARIFSVSFLARLTLSLSLFRLLFLSYYDNSETWNYRNIQQQKQQESRLRSRHILWTSWKKRTVAGKNVHELCNSTPYLIHSKRRKKNNTKKPKKLRRVEFSVLRSYDTSRWTWNRRCVKWKIKAPLQYEPTRLKEKLWKKVENLIWLTWVALFSHFSVVTRKKERKKKSQKKQSRYTQLHKSCDSSSTPRLNCYWRCCAVVYMLC